LGLRWRADRSDRGRRRAIWATANWVVQVCGSDEMFFPVAQALVKSPASTWREYGPLFR